MTPFRYCKPTSVEDALAMLRGSSDGALLAGGMTLLPTLKNRLREVSDLIDLSGVSPSLAGVDVSGDQIRIGAMTSHAAVAANAELAAAYPALVALADGIGDPQVRNRGTIGGSLANNDPAADWPAAVLGGNATLVTSKRRIAADDFFQGLFATALEADELLTAVEVPRPSAAAYAKYRHKASGYAVAGVFAARFTTGVRVAVTGATSGVVRWAAAESALAADLTAHAVASLSFESDELMQDMHASAEYRAHLVAVQLRRAVAQIVSR